MRDARAHRVAAFAALLLTVPNLAVGEPLPLPSPHVRLTAGGLLAVPDGRTFDLPTATRVITPDGWALLDAEVRRLQDAETRLGAENTSLRASADTWRPGWIVVVSAVAVGLAAGWYVHARFDGGGQ
jgi:hypothetical protein